MNEEVQKEKKKIKDTRKHLSDKLIRGLNVPGSVGDDTVVGLRVHVNKGGSKTLYYHYSDKHDGKKRHKEKIGVFPNVNVAQARNQAKVIAADVMKGKSASQIKRERQNEPFVKELMEEYVKAKLKEPKYKPSTQKRWGHFNNAWIFKKTKDKIIKAMFTKTKIDIGSKKLSEVNMENLSEFHRFVGSKSESAANTLIEMLGVIFNYAVEKKLVSNNPVKFKTEDLFEKKEDNRRLTWTQMSSVKDRAIRYDDRSKNNPRLNIDYYKEKGLNPVSCCLIGFALLTPRRYKSEGGQIQWGQISFQEKKLFLDKTKVGQKGYKLGPKALKLLRAIKNESFRKGSPFMYNDERSKYVFPSHIFGKFKYLGKVNEKPYISNVRRTWRRILGDLNITYIPTYNCRHSFLTNALSKIKSVPVVGEMAGHSKKSGYKSTLRYTKILDEDVTDALNIIDEDEAESSKFLNIKEAV